MGIWWGGTFLHLWGQHWILSFPPGYDIFFDLPSCLGELEKLQWFLCILSYHNSFYSIAITLYFYIYFYISNIYILLYSSYSWVKEPIWKFWQLLSMPISMMHWEVGNSHQISYCELYLNENSICYLIHTWPYSNWGLYCYIGTMSPQILETIWTYNLTSLERYTHLPSPVAQSRTQVKWLSRVYDYLSK